MNPIHKNTRLLALCSAAILCVSGCTMVQSLAATSASVHVSSAATTTKNTVAKHKAAKHRTAKAVVKKKVAPGKTTKKAVVTPVVKQKYKDGTYTGIGETQIGAVQVNVTLKKDKVTNVQITGYSTHYPISYIDPILPQEYLARQNINQIDVISGATLSTEDFYYAVVSCLQKAQQAQKKALASHA